MENIDHRIEISRVKNLAMNKKERYLCPSCNNITLLPKKCNSCPLHYCKICIDSLIKNKQECPRCKKTPIMTDPSLYYMSELADLLINCQFKAAGCTESIFYDHIIKHEKLCKYKDQICGKCIEKISFKEYNDHIIICDRNNFKELDDKIKLLNEKRIHEFEVIKKNISELHKGLFLSTNLFEKNIILQKEEIYSLSKRYPAITEEVVNNTISDVGVQIENLYKNNFFKVCKVVYYCKGKNNGCMNDGNVIGENPFRINSCICSAGAYSEIIKDNGGLFEVQRISNTFEMFLLVPEPEIENLKISQDSCGYVFGVCIGRNNGRCTAYTEVWGDNPYTGDSNICLAALNSGVIPIEGGAFKLEIKPGRNSYNASLANNVHTLAYGFYMNSIQISKLV